MKFDEIVERFKSPKRVNNNSIKAKCPYHNDSKASLSLTYDEASGKTLIYCHAGCDTKEILNLVGLTWSDLGSSHDSNIDNSNIENIYPYVNENGQLLYEKIRFKNKDFRQRRYVNGHTIWGLSAGVYTETFPGSNNYSPKDRPGANRITLQEQPKVLYNLPKLISSITEGYPVYIVEGEKDVNTMTKLGLTATTAPTGGGKGNKKWLDDYSKYFKGASVVIMSDNDEAGQNFAKEIKSKLKNYAHATKIVTISDKPKGDITDWINEGHTLEEFKDIINGINWSYAPWISKSNNGNLKINQGIIADCIRKTLDYILIGNPGSKKTMIFIYSNGFYKEISKKTFNKYINTYIPNYLTTSNLINNIADLLTNDDCVNYSILNGNQNIINFQNGLYNIQSNELKPHDNKYISSIQLNAKYNPHFINNGYWDKFIDNLVMSVQELKDIIQEFFGLVLSNCDASVIKKALVLYGPGDTGKSKVISILVNILGEEFSKSIPIQKLGERFELANIYKMRLIFNGDLPFEPLNEKALNVFKQLTGRDPVSTEKKGFDSFDVLYHGALAYSANNLPTIHGDLGKHVFDRFLIIPCNINSIPIEKQDPLLLQKLLLDKDYIINWSLDGLRRLIKNNFKFTYCKLCETVKEEYALKSDTILRFITENYDITENVMDKIKPKELFNAYDLWCAANGYETCTFDKFKTRIETNINLIVRKYNGIDYYRYIKLKNIPKENDVSINKIVDDIEKTLNPKEINNKEK